MSFFEELRRRNVVKVGIAYLVASWLILQLTEVLIELLKIDTDIGKIVIILLLVGFIPALIFAWAFELTPDGVKREKDVDRSQSVAPNTGKKLTGAILVMMTLAIAYLLFDKFYPPAPGPEVMANSSQQPAQDDASSPRTPPGDADAASASRQSIAVLPFENRSSEEGDSFFVAGVHDDLLTNLARIGSLKVISRTSVSKYSDTEKSIPEIARELGVATVMEGAVQRSGDTVRINVQLIDAVTDEHLWAEIFDRELTADNLFQIQTEISRAIADALHATLSPEEELQIERKPTENLAAYNAYLRGRQAMARRTSESLQTANEEFQRAVELDPNFALAWVGIAESWNLIALYGALNPDDRLRLMQDAVNRAIAIDPTLGEAYVSLAVIHDINDDFAASEQAYLKAIELSPNYSTAYHWYSTLLVKKIDRTRDALAMSEKAKELDPLSSIIRADQADTALFLGDYARAETLLNELTDLDPEFAPVYSLRARLETERGRLDRALKWTWASVEKSPGNVGQLTTEYFTYVELGLPQQAAATKSRIEDINDQHIALLFMETINSFINGSAAGAKENAEYLVSKMPFPWAQFAAGEILADLGAYDRAREFIFAARPEYLEPPQWQELFELHQDDACTAGWVLVQTGDEALGRELLQAASSYLEDVLPQYIDHADRYLTAYCHAALGDVDAAIASLQTAADHGHRQGWPFLVKAAVMKDVIVDPRFAPLSRQVTDETTRQRDAVRVMLAERAETGP